MNEPRAWNAREVKAALNYLGYGRRKAEEMCTRLELVPQVIEYVMSGVVSSRGDLENMITAIESSTLEKNAK